MESLPDATPLAPRWRTIYPFVDALTLINAFDFMQDYGQHHLISRDSPYPVRMTHPHQGHDLLWSYSCRIDLLGRPGVNISDDYPMALGFVSIDELPSQLGVVTLRVDGPSYGVELWEYFDALLAAMDRANLARLLLPSATSHPLGVRRIQPSSIYFDSALSHQYHQYPELELFCHGDLESLHTFLVQFSGEYGSAQSRVSEQRAWQFPQRKQSTGYRVGFDADDGGDWPELRRRQGMAAASWGVEWKGITASFHPVGSISAFELPAERLRVVINGFGELYWHEIQPFIAAMIVEMARQGIADIPTVEGTTTATIPQSRTSTTSQANAVRRPTAAQVRKDQRRDQARAMRQEGKTRHLIASLLKVSLRTVDSYLSDD